MELPPCFAVEEFTDWQLLSKGGFGVVFKALQQRQEQQQRQQQCHEPQLSQHHHQRQQLACDAAAARTVAIKMLLPLLPGSDAKQHARSHRRFLQEAVLQSSYKHRHIVSVLGTCRVPLPLLQRQLAAADFTPDASRTPSPCTTNTTATLRPKTQPGRSPLHSMAAAADSIMASGKVDKSGGQEAGSCLAVVYEYMNGGTLLDAIRQRQQQLRQQQLRQQQEQQQQRLQQQQQKRHNKQQLEEQQQQQYEANVLRWLLSIADALAFMHGSSPQLIHRDVKPDNVLLSAVDGQLEAKLGDFGLVAVVGQQPGTKINLIAQQQQQQQQQRPSAASSPVSGRHSPSPGALLSGSDGSATGTRLTGRCGSLLYMAPEVYRREPYEHKCDVFSFALVAYEALNAQLLTDFMAEETMDECLCHAMRVAYEGWRPPVPARAEQLPLWQLLRRCWSVDPGKRPGMSEVLAVLRSVQEGGSATAAARRSCYLM